MLCVGFVCRNSLCCQLKVVLMFNFRITHSIVLAFLASHHGGLCWFVLGAAHLSGCVCRHEWAVDLLLCLRAFWSPSPTASSRHHRMLAQIDNVFQIRGLERNIHNLGYLIVYGARDVQVWRYCLFLALLWHFLFLLPPRFLYNSLLFLWLWHCDAVLLLRITDDGYLQERIVVNLGLEMFEQQIGRSLSVTKAVWVPNSASRLAVTTSHHVKVFDLSKDVISPLFTCICEAEIGTIRDSALAVRSDSATSENITVVFMMNATGAIFLDRIPASQEVDSGQRFFVRSLSLQWRNRHHLFSGVPHVFGSLIFFSHSMRLLIVCYKGGHNFAVQLDQSLEECVEAWNSEVNPNSSTDIANRAPSSPPSSTESSSSASSSASSLNPVTDILTQFIDVHVPDRPDVIACVAEPDPNPYGYDTRPRSSSRSILFLYWNRDILPSTMCGLVSPPPLLHFRLLLLDLPALLRVSGVLFRPPFPPLPQPLQLQFLLHLSVAIFLLPVLVWLCPLVEIESQECLIVRSRSLIKQLLST